jgi:membrane-bound metal-dependent hydrolase YbcI (DUF457 family)
MDTITHGIAGALIAKAAFGGQEMFAAKPVTRARIITWSLMLGAIFPDADVFRDMLSRNDLLILTWHRSITHSLLFVPLFASILAFLTVRYTRWRKWDAPGFAALAGVYAVGILSHILLDVVTSFGTMVWSPINWSRPAWDLIFIVDFTFSAILLVPQILQWVYAKPEGLQRRALISWLFCGAVALGISALALSIGAPISLQAVLLILIILTALFLLPAVRGWGRRVPAAAWNLAGLLIAGGYVGLASYAHHSAVAKVDGFASALHLEVQSRGALPFPPSICTWDGLIRTPRGVYELRIDLSDGMSGTVQSASASHPSPQLTYRYYPDAVSNRFIDAAKRMPEVQTIMWFARFPVTRFHSEGDVNVVEISDLRFPQLRSDRPASFTYRVRFAADQTVLSQGWAKP